MKYSDLKIIGEILLPPVFAPCFKDERMSLDVDTLTSQSDVSVKSAVAKSSHEGGGAVVHPGEESTAQLFQRVLFDMFFHYVLKGFCHVMDRSFKAQI